MSFNMKSCLGILLVILALGVGLTSAISVFEDLSLIGIIAIGVLVMWRMIASALVK